MLQRTSDKGEAMMVATDTELPSKFVELDDTFVSLGQDDDFYKNCTKRSVIAPVRCWTRCVISLGARPSPPTSSRRLRSETQ